MKYKPIHKLSGPVLVKHVMIFMKILYANLALYLLKMDIRAWKEVFIIIKIVISLNDIILINYLRKLIDHIIFISS
jgi:hypothetical protein